MFIVKILLEHRIIGFYRYVDDILIMHDSNVTHVDQVLAEFNMLHPNLALTTEKEINSSINFLHLIVCNKNGHLEFKIYRKPRNTDNSCHTFEHKISAISIANMERRSNSYAARVKRELYCRLAGIYMF
jgi:hypothetical protein